MPKRWFDCLAAACGLLVLSPLLLVLAGLIKLDDGGDVLFVQWRLGRDKRPFRIFKLRTMRDGAVTRIGRWLRATGLDELPQLANVLLGDMSLIGPRPLTADDVARLRWGDDAHALRWRVRPGIVGLAQLHAGRGRRVSWFFDRRYVTTRGVGRDAAILLLSAAIGVLGKRRVRAWLRAPRPSRVAAPSACAENGVGLRSLTPLFLFPARSDSRS